MVRFSARYKGFIPWDDDIDIHMDYKDLKKLKKYAKKELDKDFFWQDQHTDKGFIALYSTVRDTRTLMYSHRANHEVELQKKTNNGIWIDIMPLFKAAKNEELLKKQIEYMYKYQRIAVGQRKISAIKGSHFYSTMIMILTEIFKYRPLAWYYYLRMRMLQSDESDSYIHFGFYSVEYFFDFEKVFQCAKKFLIPKELVENKAEYSFEQYKFTSFADYDRYLRINYGDDYMTPIKRPGTDDYSRVIIKDHRLSREEIKQYEKNI